MRWIRRSKWWGGLVGASGGVEARLAWKYPETSCSYTFELCRQGSEKLPMCAMSLDNSQNLIVRIPDVYTYFALEHHVFLRTVLFKRILNPSRDCKRDSMVYLKMYSHYIQYLLIKAFMFDNALGLG